MLSAEHRLRASTEFTQVVRRGRRAARPTLAVHVLVTGSGEAPRVGLIVSKAVGGSTVRHRVARRVRHQVRERIDRLPVGALVVVRASPAAATATSAVLGADFDLALSRVVRR